MDDRKLHHLWDFVKRVPPDPTTVATIKAHADYPFQTAGDARCSISEAIQKAVAENNAHIAGVCAETLRLRCGMTYAEILEFAKKCVPSLTDTQWEDLMYDAEG